MHPDQHDDARDGGHDHDKPDGRREAGGVGDDTGDDGTNSEAEVAPETMDPNRGATPDRLRDVSDGRQQGRVDRRGAEPQEAAQGWPADGKTVRASAISGATWR